MSDETNKPDEQVEQPATEAPASADSTATEAGTGDKAKEAVGDAAKAATEAAQDAMQAAIDLVADPMAGQAESYKKLGDMKAMAVGLVFIFLWVLFFYLGMLRTGFLGSVKFHFGAIFVGIAAPMAIAGCHFGAGAAFSKERNTFPLGLFAAGITSIPVTVFAVFQLIVGANVPELSFLLFVFLAALAVVLLSGSLLYTLKLSSRVTALAGPTIVVIAAFAMWVITKIFGG